FAPLLSFPLLALAVFEGLLPLALLFGGSALALFLGLPLLALAVFEGLLPFALLFGGRALALFLRPLAFPLLLDTGAFALLLFAGALPGLQRFSSRLFLPSRGLRL